MKEYLVIFRHDMSLDNNKEHTLKEHLVLADSHKNAYEEITKSYGGFKGFCITSTELKGDGPIMEL